MNGPSSKSIVLELLAHGFGQGDRSVFERLVAENYIQHNPWMSTGRKGILALLDELQKLETNEFRLVRVLEDDNLVLLHSEWSPPGHKRAVFDLFRAENGWLVEHWDAMQDQPPVMAHGRTMLDGPTEVTDRERTRGNKVVVGNFIRTVLVERRLDRVGEFFRSGQFIQHSPAVRDDVSGFLTYVGGFEDGTGVQYQKLHRIVGEGNFVFTQSEGIVGLTRSAVYDLFRVENGRLAEHWNVTQAIPPRLAHDNGMF